MLCFYVMTTLYSASITSTHSRVDAIYQLLKSKLSECKVHGILSIYWCTHKLNKIIPIAPAVLCKIPFN